MNKPSTILRQEFIEKQVELINDSGLPAFALVSVMEDALTQLRRLAESQYQRDKAEWEEYQRQLEEKKVETDQAEKKKESEETRKETK